METLELLKDLGMDVAAHELESKMVKQRKLHTAYQKFQFITKQAVDSYNAKLKEKTECYWDHEMKKKLDKKTALTGTRGNKHAYDQLVFCSLREYAQVPPVSVLEKIRAASELKCFDSFTVAKIESVVKVVDPIVFGQIKGCTDLFYIDQWDNDVKIEDLLKEQSSVNV